MPLKTIRANRRWIVRIIALVFLSAIVARWVSHAAPAGAAGTPSENVRNALPATNEPGAFVKRAVIISIDGLRPDLLLRARTPHLRGLMEQGSYTMWARTTEMSITLPSHTSMVTGVTPDYHRIIWNYYIKNVYPDVPTIFELAQRMGYTTALCSGKTKFHELCSPGSVNWTDVFWENATRKVGPDLDTAEAACSILRRYQPNVLFMHLGQVDETGHGIGWATPQQIAAIERADAAVGQLMDALREMQLFDQTLIIISADHGGQGKTHGPNDPRSRHIPWIAVGPGIKKDYDLTRHADLVVNTEDTFATACHLLRIRVPGKVDGKFVNQILERPEPEKPKKKGEQAKSTDEDKYNRWEAPPYKPEWERLEQGHRS